MEIKIGNFTLGQDHLPAFIAELGICHLGDVNRAIQTVAAVFKAGGPCIVKTETFQPDKMVIDKEHRIISKIINSKGEIEDMDESLLEHMERFHLTLKEHQQICEYVHKNGGAFLSTAHDYESVDFLQKIKADAIKIASPDIVHIPLLRYAAQTGLPIVLDTGGATRWEIARAVWTVRETGNEQIIVNHHPGGHPAPAEGYGLDEMVNYRTLYNTVIGTADHYHGEDMIMAAAALNSDFIEKPVTLEPNIPEPEQIYATPVERIGAVRNSLESIWKASLPQKERTGSRNASGRMSFRAARDMKAGDLINYEDTWPSRPRSGIGVENWDLVENTYLQKDISKGDDLTWSHIK
jgi:N,N'-diacetyllegionaminate synthase